MPKGKGPKPPPAGEITAFGVDIIKQYPGQEQVDLSVLVEIPGSWFGGALTTNERRDKYEAQAVEFTEVYEFGSGKKATIPMTSAGGSVSLTVTSTMMPSVPS